jgi:peptidoglycan/LPS O-acetylase OafA/YrhL
MSNPKKDSKYYVHIDGLRAFAVLSVIAYHLNPAWLPGGFAGVDIFFVISGFVVSASVAHLDTSSFKQFLLHFYTRRIQRIVPALVVCLLVTTLFSALFIPSAWLSDKNQMTGLAAFFGLSNILLARAGNDYFSPTSEYNPFTHTWSLGVEEQFYFLFPFFIYLAAAKGKRATANLLFALGALVSLGIAYFLGRTNSLFAFYLIVSRFWELAAGVLLYSWLSRPDQPATRPRPRPWLVAGGLAVSVALLLYAVVASSARSFPFPGALPAVLGVLGLLYFLHDDREHGVLWRVLSSKLAVFLGKISYSLYLWHWPVIVLFRWTYGEEGPVQQVIIVLLTLALALASYYLVENKVRYADFVQRMSRPRRLFSGFALVGVAFVVASVTVLFQSALSLSTVNRHVADWDPHTVVQRDPDNQCQLELKRGPVVGGSVWQFTRKQCALAPVSQHKLFVMGDSHAGHFNVMLSVLSLETGIPVYIYSTEGCAFLGLRKPLAPGDRCYQPSRQAFADVLSKVSAGDVLLLSSLRLKRLGDQWVKFDETALFSAEQGATLAERKAAEAEAGAILAAFAAKGVRIVFAGPTPVFRVPAFRCSDWFNKSNPLCVYGDTISREDIEQFRAPVMQSMARLAQSVPGVTIWDSLPILCPGQVCKAVDQQVPLFFDGDHLSAYANRLLLADFRQLIAREMQFAPALAATRQKNSQ